MIKVLIVDDDFGMRRVLRKALSKNENFEVIGEAENGVVGLELFKEDKPDVVFMDIEMPEMSGCECAKRIFDINPKTKIIFATAYEGFMQEAFDVYAFDYLVKPFDMERLNNTITRLIEVCNDIHGEDVRKIANAEKSKLIIKNKDGMQLINVEDIIVIQREDGNTVIYTEKSKVITTESLSHIEERLDFNKFMRTHKSYIVNISRITNIYPYGRWTYILKFGNLEIDALITHKKFNELEKFFN